MKPINYQRRQSSVVQVGNVPMGGENPIRIQTMINVSTMDTEASVSQAVQLIDHGAEYVRFTAQGEREAKNLQVIHDKLLSLGYHTPLVADIHFNPKAADVAATIVDKVRINPGNYVDKVKTFDSIEYTEAEYKEELQRIRRRFVPFLNICKQHQTAIRIGVNHGSLSDRIMTRYGDTPEGMVASCMEFLRICKEEHFDDVVISMKASNTVVMVYAVQLLVKTMNDEEMNYPLHLGVTEAGDGEDGRIKSAVGIGALLADGIGDTIRVSLSEEPEKELPVARELRDYIIKRSSAERIKELYIDSSAFNERERRQTIKVGNIGGNAVPVVISNRSKTDNYTVIPDFIPDYIYLNNLKENTLTSHKRVIVDVDAWKDMENVYPLFTNLSIAAIKGNSAAIKFLLIDASLIFSKEHIEFLKNVHNLVVILTTSHANPVGAIRNFMSQLLHNNCHTPVIVHLTYNDDGADKEVMQIKASADFGTLILDGLVDGIMITADAFRPTELDSTAYAILQATRTRISKTEYISCPGCGRTLFNLQETIQRVKKVTSHLKGLKIGIMGCIVNGPGEMADADYGYVGAGKGRVSLYKGKVCIKKNIPEDAAVDELVNLIKEHGDWLPR